MMQVTFIKGRVTRTQVVNIGTEPFVAVEVGDVSVDEAPPLPPHSVRAPLAPTECKTAIALVAASPPATVEAGVVDLVGKSVAGLRLGDRKVQACEIIAGQDGMFPGSKPFDASSNWKKSVTAPEAAALAALGAARELYGTKDELSKRGLAPTPIDKLLEPLLLDMTSTSSLAFALDHRLYYFAVHRHFRWPRSVESFPIIEKDLLERPWAPVGDKTPGTVPGGFETALLWRTSPTKAQASLRALYERDPEKAMTILRSSPPMDAAFDLLIELTQRDRAKWLPWTLSALSADGNERTLEFMKKERSSVPDHSSKELDRRIAGIERRAALGVVDGHTLARYLWAHRKNGHDAIDFRGMRVTLVAEKDNCCDAKADLGGGVELRARVQCDAETFKEMCERARGDTVTVVGTLDSEYVGDKTSRGGDSYVELRLEFAHVELGGTMPPTPRADVEPQSPEPAKAPLTEKKGCACTTAPQPDAPAWAASLALAALTLSRRARRSPRSSAR